MTEPTAEDEARALAGLHETGDAIVAGAEVWIPRWVQAQVDRLLDAWGRASPEARADARSEAIEAGNVAARRVVTDLRELFATDPEQQRVTPLEIVRTAYREPTAVLARAGVSAVVRDEFEGRAWPEDVYGLVPRTLGDLGDPELAPLHLAWGMAKATVIRDRRARRAS